MRLHAKRWEIIFPVVLLCLLALGSFVRADEEMYVMHALPLGEASPPKIDGRMDEAVWEKAVPISGFTQKEPYFGQPATQDTEIRIVYSRTHLYVGARCFSKPDQIIKQLSRRDNAYDSDAIAIFLDSRFDHRTGYKFACNALGVQQDSYRYNDSSKDISWDGFWRCETSIDSLGWVAEFEIPMSNLRFSDQEEQTWGINFERWFRDGESTSWKPISPDDGGNWRMSSLAHLVGIRDIRQGKHLEITPYATTWLSKHEEEKASGKPDFGFDAKYGITTNLRANLTVNPDFAQVEADLIEINLSRFQTWLPEKRLFFMEGNSVFSTPMELFYSRRIGTQGDILWGTKVNGKVGGTVVGFLGAQTGDWNYFGLRDKEKGKEQALYSAFRVSKDLFRRSSVGILMATKDWEDTYSRVVGIDGRFGIQKKYVASGQIAQVWSPNFSANNRAYTFQVDRTTDLLTVGFSAERTDPHFDANATGYIRKEEDRGWESAGGWVEYRPRIAVFGTRQLFVGYEGGASRGLFTDAYFTRWETLFPGSISPEFEKDLVSFSNNTWLSVSFRPEYLLSSIRVFYDYGKDVELTDIFSVQGYGASLSTQGYRRLVGSMNVSSRDYYNFDQKYVGNNKSVSAGGSARPNDHLDLNLGVNYVVSYDPQGGTDARFWTGSLRSTYLLNKDAFLRVFAQTGAKRTYYDQVQTERTILISGLLGWEFLPKSTLFLAYNEDRNASGTHFRLSDRVLVAKVSYFLNR
ncbi:MAG: DUF5916 domain-containing protein [Candidatus Latescibacterota bacterium]